MCGQPTLWHLHSFLLFRPILFSIPDCCARSSHKMRPQCWWTLACVALDFRPSSRPRLILLAGNCAALLFWNTIGLRRKTVFLKKVCALDWKAILLPRWMSPLSLHTMSRRIENAGQFGFPRYRFRIEHWQSVFCSIQYKRVLPTFPRGFMLRSKPFLSLFYAKRRSH